MGVVDALFLILHLGCFLQDVLKSTREQLERELELEDVFSVRDLPAYNMLTR